MLRDDPGQSLSLKSKVAREAAYLLYRGFEKEYKQAKLKAAETLGTNSLPSNRQVALHLDKIAEETEGAVRRKHLLQMRQQAYELMKVLKDYHPVLVGSVWRGTIHHNSDLDLTVYSHDPQDVLKKINQNNLKILGTEWVTVPQKDLKKEYLHIYLELSNNQEVEVIVRSPEEMGQTRTCEIFGDRIFGLNLRELKKLLEEDPNKRFLPI